MENFEAADLMQGDVLVLQPEPSNRFDPNAIRVLKDSQPIGYVPADRCRAMLAFMLDYRVEVVVNACGPTHCQVNVRLYRKD